MAGRNHADVHLHRPLGAQWRHLLFGQYAQQAGLQVQRHVTDLVEEQGAAVGLLDQAAHALLRAPVKVPGA